MSFGKILKEKREEKNIKLETVSNAIKVKGDFLKAFEEENFDQMPKEPFATGFLKNYIDFLELKESEVYDLYLEFKKQIHTEELNKNLNHKKSKKNLNNDFTENIKIKLFELKNILRNNPKIKNINFLNIFFVILGVVVFLLLIVFIKTNAFVCNSKKSANVANPKISKDCKSVQKVENVTFYKKNINYNYVLEFTPNKHCWLKVESDGKLLFKDVLPPAVSRKWYADKNFNIVIGNIESGNMFLNGKSINLKKDADGKKNKIILDQSTTAYWLLAGDVK